MRVCNLSHYSFFTVQDPAKAAEDFRQILAGRGILGTVLIAPEGVNMNLAGPKQEVIKLTQEWLKSIGCTEFEFKLSFSDTIPFKRLKIKVKPEIITMGITDLDVAKYKGDHISSKEFEALLKNPGDTLILDTRNEFEFDYGSFRGAEKIPMKSFRSFPAIADTIDPNRPVVMFCTGGVRCEKASAYMMRKGFKSVRQLKGGVLRYLEDCGPELWNGDCFVFDERISVREIEDENISQDEAEELSTQA